MTTQSPSSSLCLAPWVHAYVSPSGERRLCCVAEQMADRQVRDPLSDYWNSNELRQVRKQMLDGKKVSACKTCDFEAYGGNVLKNHYNHKYAHHLDRIRSETTADGSYSTPPVSFDYRNSICNFKCRMCGPGNSNSWQNELRRNGLENCNYDSTDEAFYEDLLTAAQAGRVEEIYWAGGEPLILAQHWQVMNRLIEMDAARHIDVRYSTNLSTIRFPTPDHKHSEILDLVGHFKSASFYLSQDSVSTIGEYLRSGLNWSKWFENFRHFVKNRPSQTELVIDCTMTLPGLLYAEEFLDFFNRYDVRISAKPVLCEDREIVLSPLALPNKLFEEFMSERLKALKPYRTRNNHSFFSSLEAFARMPTFETQAGDSYRAKLATSKSWALQLDRMRNKNAGLSTEEVLRRNARVLSWWTEI